jgi:hypothetical protein
LLSYHLEIRPTDGLVDFTGLPHLLVYDPGLSGQRADFCVGTCIFGATPMSTLQFSNGLQRLQLAFTPTPDRTTWGSLVYGSALRTPANSLGDFLIPVRAAALSPVVASVPEPPTFWLMLLGFVGLAVLVAWRSRPRKTGTA